MYRKKDYRNGEKRKNAIGETLEIIEVLFNNGVNISEMKMCTHKYGKQVMLKLKDIPGLEQIIIDNNLDEDYPIGQRIGDLRRTARGTATCSITQEQREKIEKFGVIPEKRKKELPKKKEKARKTKVDLTLDILETLDKNNIDLTQIGLYKSVDGKAVSVKLKDIPGISKILEQNQLDGDYPIGMRITNLKQAFRGNRPPKLTQKQKERIINLGLIGGKRKSVVDGLINILKLLKNNGIELFGIQVKKRENGKICYKKLKEIPNTEQIIEEHDLDGDMLIGSRIANLISSVNGKGPYTLTDSQIEEIKHLNLSIGRIKRLPTLEDKLKLEREAQIDEFLRVMSILVANGIDVLSLSLYKVKSGKKVVFLLKDIPGAKEIIDKENLDENYPIGQGLKCLRSGIRKKEGITEEQLVRFLELISSSSLEKKVNAKALAEKRRNIAKTLFEQYKELEAGLEEKNIK